MFPCLFSVYLSSCCLIMVMETPCLNPVCWAVSSMGVGATFHWALRDNDRSALLCCCLGNPESDLWGRTSPRQLFLSLSFSLSLCSSVIFKFQMSFSDVYRSPVLSHFVSISPQVMVPTKKSALGQRSLFYHQRVWNSCHVLSVTKKSQANTTDSPASDVFIQSDEGMVHVGVRVKARAISSSNTL